MKQDQLLEGLISFLVPIIFLYAVYSLSDLFFGNGFFALVYSVVLFACAIMLYSINHRKTKNLSAIHIEITAFITALISIIYLVATLFLITSNFSI